MTSAPVKPMAMAMIPFGTSFVGVLLIVELAGPEAMGFAEAARVAAQPILVLATGLSAVLGPRGMEAAIRRTRPQAQKVLRLFLTLAHPTKADVAQILHPFKVGHRHTARICIEVGDDDAAFFTQDFVGSGRDGAICSLNDQWGLYAFGVR